MSQKPKPQRKQQRPSKAPEAATLKPAAKPKIAPKKKSPKSKPAKPEVVEASIVPASEFIEEFKPDEAQFIDEYFKNGSNGTKAALKIWPHLTKGSAATTAERLLKRAQGVLASYMDEKGLTLYKLFDIVAEGLAATEAITLRETLYKDGRMSKKTEKIAFSPDFSTRRAYVELALKVRGALVNKPPEIIVIPTTTINNSSNILNLEAKKEMLDGFTQYMMDKTSADLLRNVENLEKSHARRHRNEKV